MAHTSETHTSPASDGRPPEGHAFPAHGAAQPITADAKFSLATPLIIFAAVILISVAFSIRSRMAAEKSLREETLKAAAIPVSVTHPVVAATTDEITLPGNAQAFLNTPIFSRTSGYLKKWDADIGDHVKKGQLLAEIETPEVDQQLEQAQANLKNAQANLEISQITANRLEGLFKNKTVSSQERDQAASDLAAKKALVDSGKANVSRLEQMKAFEQVLAPFDGIVTARNTDIGALIQAGDAAGAKELFHMADNHILRVYFSVPEVYSSTIKAGESMLISFDSVPGEEFPGALVRDSASLDPLAHTLTVEADVENPSGRLFSGGHATVHLKLPAAEGTVAVPSNALLFRGKEICVGLNRDGKAAIVPIQIARDHGSSVDVLGVITANDSVILNPPDSLAEGDVLQVEQEPKFGL